MRLRLLTIWFMAVAPGLVFAAGADISSAASERPLYEIAMKENPDFPDGKVGMVQNTVDSVGDRYQFKDTGIMQPVGVSVFTKNPTDSARVRVVKTDWSKPERDVVTSNGRADFKFRTYDGFRLWITADSPMPYQLVVWIGDEIKLSLPPITTPMSVYKQRHPEVAESVAGNAIGTNASPSTWLAGLLGFGIAIAVAAFFMRRKSS